MALGQILAKNSKLLSSAWAAKYAKKPLMPTNGCFSFVTIKDFAPKIDSEASQAKCAVCAKVNAKSRCAQVYVFVRGGAGGGRS